MTSPRTPSKLEGVLGNADLFSLFEECLSICKEKEGEFDQHGTNNSGDTTCEKSPDVIRNALSPMSAGEAYSLIVNHNYSSKHPNLSIHIVRAMAVILDDSARLEAAIRNSSGGLFFGKQSDTKVTELQKKHRQRMERLRLANEERSYFRLTENIANVKGNDDEITTKSMTYAASIGLNMIVAPLSFGCFMYFFSGPLLNYFLPRTIHHPSSVDIRQVITGVVSGVAMLFIEMILFVIRTHEFDRGLRIKKKKKGKSVKPFGEYSSASTKTFTSDNN